MDERSIGVFDSGLGGLTAFLELSRILPNENIVYFGDTGRVPYGTKSKETIINYTKSDINFLMTFDLKLIVAACGTASSIALPHIKNDYNVPIIGVVEPTVKAAAGKTKNKKIGVLATSATIKSDLYGRLIKEIDSEISVVSKACPMFVPLVENGYITGEVIRIIAEEYLAPLKEAEVDTVILGCTHYPLIKDVIQSILGKDVTLVNSGSAAAYFAKEYLDKNNLLSDKKTKGEYKFFVSDEPAGFEKVGERFLGKSFEQKIQKADIEKY